MSTPAKLAAFAAVLAVALAAALGVGAAVGPLGQTTRDTDHRDTHQEEERHMTDTVHEPDHGGHAGHGDQGRDAHADHGGPDAAQLGGLAVADDGYALELESVVAQSGRSTVRFQVTGPDGQPVTAFEPTHEKDLHLIAVRRDTTGFQHVHPTMAEDGTWTVELDYRPGVWRLFADFHPQGGPGAMTLGADVSVAGDYDPRDIPAPRATAEVDGYTITLEGDLRAGETSEVTLTVHKDGRPVTDLEPYLGAFGHLVALRAGDLAYLHVHPDGEPDDGSTQPGPAVRFFVAAPTAGWYRLYLDFQHDGVVRTAEFTAQVAANPN